MTADERKGAKSADGCCRLPEAESKEFDLCKFLQDQLLLEYVVESRR